MSPTIHVCRGCKPRGGTPGGEVLLAELESWAAEGDVRIVSHACLGPCGVPGRVVVSGPGRWSWLLAGIAPGADIEALGAFIAAWREAPAGLVAKNDRPERLRQKILGRVPPALPNAEQTDNTASLQTGETHDS